MSFSMATSSTPQLADYLSWDTVWFFHGPLDAQYTTEGDPRQEGCVNMDWETIADQAVACGNVNGASIHVISQAGWRAFYSGEFMAQYSDGGRNYPYYNQNYGIYSPECQALGIEVDTVYRFVKAFRSRGIKVGFYVQVHEARNLMSYGGVAESVTARQTYLNYLLREIKWLNTLYSPDWYWLDQPYDNGFSEGPGGQRDQLYQALKTAPNSIPLVMHNGYGGGSHFKYPCDVLFAEHPNGLFTSSAYNPVTVVSSGPYAGTYYIPKGWCGTGMKYTDTPPPGYDRQWYYLLNAPAGTATFNIIENQAFFDTWYTYCKVRTYPVPMFISIPAEANGLNATYLSRLTNMST